MVTVLVEKRGFRGKPDKAEKPASTGRPNRAEKPTPKEPPVQDSSASAATGQSAIEQPSATPVDARRDERSASDRFRQISVFAYFKAEQRGFAPGHMWDDWLAAEREVDSPNEPGHSRG